MLSEWLHITVLQVSFSFSFPPEKIFQLNEIHKSRRNLLKNPTFLWIVGFSVVSFTSVRPSTQNSAVRNSCVYTPSGTINPRDPESFDSMRRSLAGLLAYSTSAAYRLPDGSVTYDKPLLHTVTRSRRPLTCFPILRFLTAPAASYLISHNLHKHYSSLSEIINCFSAIFSFFLHYFARFFINNR